MVIALIFMLPIEWVLADTYKLLGNCSALYWGVNLEFLSFFFANEDRAVGSCFAMLTLFWRRRGSVCGWVPLLCHPDLPPSVQFSPDMFLFHTKTAFQWNYIKLCQILWYSALKNRFHFNWPIPEFCPRFCERGNHSISIHLEFCSCPSPKLTVLAILLVSTSSWLYICCLLYCLRYTVAF